MFYQSEGITIILSEKEVKILRDFLDEMSRPDIAAVAKELGGYHMQDVIDTVSDFSALLRKVGRDEWEKRDRGGQR